jgi:hypothetical protein
VAARIAATHLFGKQNLHCHTFERKPKIRFINKIGLLIQWMILGEMILGTILFMKCEA